MSIPIDYFKSIKWPEFLKNRHLQFKGRNGYVNCLGVEINKGLATDSIRITALNSRSWGESCWVEIPEEKRLDVCLAMVPELKDLIRAVPDEALPSLPSSLDTLVEQRIR